MAQGSAGTDNGNIKKVFWCFSRLATSPMNKILLHFVSLNCLFLNAIGPETSGPSC